MKTKTCNKCNETKSVELFYTSKTLKDGYMTNCKECHNNESKKNMKKWTIENPYLALINNRWASINQRTVNGKFTTSQSAQKCPQLKNYRDRGITLDMTYEEFKGWMLANEGIHNEIVATGDKSSIDRIDEELGYSLDNIQLIPLHKNIEKRFGKECEKLNEYEKQLKKEQNKRVYEREGVKINTIEYNGKIYQTKKELAIELGMVPQELYREIERGNIIVSNPIREYPTKQKERKQTNKELYFDGKIFNTQNEIADYLNISSSKLSKMISSGEINIRKGAK